MKRIKYRSKIQKAIKRITMTAFEDVKDFFREIKSFQKLAAKIPEDDQEEYEKYFRKYMTHERNLRKIEYRKIEMNYKESVFRTDKKAAEFEQKLADPNLNADMNQFYRKEFLNILKPMYIIEQVMENYGKYLEVLEIIMDEFNEWFFLKRSDYLKQLLSSYIVPKENSKKEIWIYQKFAKQMTAERKAKMFKRAGLKPKKR